MAVETKFVADVTVVADVMIIMDMGTASATIKGGDPTYVAFFKKDKAFSMPGLWDISLKIQRPHQAPAQVSFQMTLTG